MWYVVDCGPDAALRVGFDGPVTREQYAEHVERGTLPELMAKARVHPGDTFFIPAGTVHTIEGSVLIAEIQQASDITYRIYDWDRVGPDGRKRELQTDPPPTRSTSLPGRRSMSRPRRSETGSSR